MDTPPIESPTIDEWIDRFKASPDRRRAMVEALAWSLKALVDRLSKTLRGKLDQDFEAIEDLLVFSSIALFPAEKRYEVVTALAPMLGELRRAEGGDEIDHQKVHDLIVRAIDRVSQSLEEEPKPHPMDPKAETP